MSFIALYEIKETWKVDDKKEFEFKYRIDMKKFSNVFWMEFSSAPCEHLLILYTEKRIKDFEGTFTDDQT